MRIRAVYVPERDLEILNKLVEAGYYLNVSEAIRTAIKDLILSESERIGVSPEDLRDLKRAGGSFERISLYMPVAMLREIDALVEGGYYRSRAELIRTAVKELLKQETKLMALESDPMWRLDYGHE